MHPKATVHSVAALAREGLNASEIAGRTGIPRSTVREWLLGRTPRHARSGRCEGCGGRQHDYPALPSQYVYLLGMYLGDGCISSHRRGVYRLRISLDAKYPGIIDECMGAARAVLPANKVSLMSMGTWFVVSAYSKSLPCLFPQHGAGLKHERAIDLAKWQTRIVVREPRLLLRGLIHSDGCRFMNTGTGWRYPRYAFDNVSADIRAIFCAACDLVGVRYTFAPGRVYVSRKADVALLDEFIGPKT